MGNINQKIYTYYKVNEASTNGTDGELLDSSFLGNFGGKALQLVNLVQSGGLFGNCISGTNGTVSLQLNNEKNTLNISFWVKPTTADINGSYICILHKNNDYYVAFNAGAIVFRNYKHSDSLTTAIAGFVADSWNHVAISVDVNGTIIWVNNVQVGSNAILDLNTYSTELFLFNFFGDTSSSNLKGAVDEIVHYERLIDDTDVASLYNNGSGIELVPEPPINVKYRVDKATIDAIHRWDNSATAYTYIGNGDVDFDILPIDVQVGDCINFSNTNANGGKFWKLEVDIQTPISATIDGVWEVRTIQTSIYNNYWTPIMPTEDTINNFKNSGTRYISFEPPTTWDNAATTTGLNYYVWNLRYRITTISSVNIRGQITKASSYQDTIVVDGEDVRMKDIHFMDELMGWGKVKRTGETTYNLDCNLRCESNSIFRSSRESITFLHNFMPFINGTSFFGELTSTGKPTYGTSFRCEGANNDYNAASLGKINSEFYDFTVKFPREEREVGSQGFWGAGVGSYENQKIRGGSLSDFRNYSFSNQSNIITGLTYKGTFTEPSGAIMIDMEVQSSYYAIRQDGKHNVHVHRLNCLDVTTATTNPWRVSANNGWRNYLVDCKINWDLPLALFYVNSGDAYYPNVQVEAISSFQGQVLDSNNNLMGDASVTIFNNKREVVGELSVNEDGYIGKNLGVTANTGVNIVECTDFYMGGMLYKEILFTSGKIKGHRSVVYKALSNNSIELAEINTDGFDEGDRFVEIPYITYKSQAVQEDNTSGYGNSPIVEHGAFPVRYRKFGYKFTELSKAFDTPVVDSAVLFVNTDISMTIEEVENFEGINFNHHEIPVQEYGEFFSITLDCNNYTLEEVYNFLQWRLSQNNTFSDKHCAAWHDCLIPDGNGYKTVTGVYKSILSDEVVSCGVRVINIGAGELTKIQSDNYVYAQPFQYAYFRIEDMKPYSKIRIYDKNTKDILYEDLNTNTAITYNYTWTEDTDIIIVVMHNEAFQVIQEKTLTNISQTISVIQAESYGYNNPSAPIIPTNATTTQQNTSVDITKTMIFQGLMFENQSLSINDIASFTVLTPPPNGTLEEIEPNLTWRYTPPLGHLGGESFSFVPTYYTEYAGITTPAIFEVETNLYTGQQLDNLLIIGDSINAGVFASGSFSTRFATMHKALFGRSINMINRSVPGDKSENVLEDIPNIINELSGLQGGTLVVCMVGTNDIITSRADEETRQTVRNKIYGDMESIRDAIANIDVSKNWKFVIGDTQFCNYDNGDDANTCFDLETIQFLHEEKGNYGCVYGTNGNCEQATNLTPEFTIIDPYRGNITRGLVSTYELFTQYPLCFGDQVHPNDDGKYLQQDIMLMSLCLYNETGLKPLAVPDDVDCMGYDKVCIDLHDGTSTFVTDYLNRTYNSFDTSVIGNGLQNLVWEKDATSSSIKVGFEYNGSNLATSNNARQGVLGHSGIPQQSLNTCWIIPKGEELTINISGLDNYDVYFVEVWVCYEPPSYAKCDGKLTEMKFNRSSVTRAGTYITSNDVSWSNSNNHHTALVIATGDGLGQLKLTPDVDGESDLAVINAIKIYKIAEY